jgi:hypothetical protein
MTPQGQMGAPAQQPGWFSRNWKWLLALGCLLPMMCCGIFGAVAFFSASKVIKGTPVFAEAIEKANRNPEVTAALGSPVTPGMVLAGNVKNSGNTGSADFTIPLKGPKGEGSLHLRATMKGGKWTFDSLTADVGGRSIDLLAGDMPKLPAGTPPSMNDAPPDDAPPPGDLPPGDDAPTGELPPEE